MNQKRVFRVYREAGLAVRRKARKSLVREGFSASGANGSEQEWAVDFTHDATASGRAIRVLSVVDECTRAGPGRLLAATPAERWVTSHIGDWLSPKVYNLRHPGLPITVRKCPSQLGYVRAVSLGGSCKTFTQSSQFGVSVFEFSENTV